MRGILLSTVCAGVAVLFSVQLLAQIKGDPVLKAAPQQPAVQKTSSRLSPALQKLYDNTTAARKAEASGEKPVVSYDALDKYLQVKGDKVVVDITVKENMAGAKTALQQLGLKITGVYGRVISGIIPINALPQLAQVGTVQAVLEFGLTAQHNLN